MVKTEQLEKYRTLYEPMHTSDKKFIGKMDLAQRNIITNLVQGLVLHKVVPDYHRISLLDYGSGKGYQYLVQRAHEHWGNILPHCYDIGVRYLSQRPTGKFHGVICCDMLEHIAKEDLDDVIEDIYDFVIPGGFVYLHIACRPAKKTFPDGRNVHLTIEPPEWWGGKLTRRGYDHVSVTCSYELT